MRTSILKSVSGVLAMASFVGGCYYTPGPTPPPPTCTSNASYLTVVNNSGEGASLTIDGAAYVLAAAVSQTYTVTPGTHRVTATGQRTSALLADSTDSYLCNQSYELVLSPYTPPPPMHLAYGDVVNNTSEQLDVYIDGLYMNRVNPGVTGEYEMEEGYHTLRVVQVDTGHDLLNTREFFRAGQVLEFEIVSTHPLVEIRNNLAGMGGECVNTFLDTEAILFDSGFYNVCPLESGFFSVFHGDYQLEVFGEDTGLEYLNDLLHFPENATTVVTIE